MLCLCDHYNFCSDDDIIFKNKAVSLMRTNKIKEIFFCVDISFVNLLGSLCLNVFTQSIFKSKKRVISILSCGCIRKTYCFIDFKCISETILIFYACKRKRCENYGRSMCY